jgi:hypothetical protein
MVPGRLADASMGATHAIASALIAIGIVESP